MFRVIRSFQFVILALLILDLIGCVPAQADSDLLKSQSIIVLVDRSSSMDQRGPHLQEAIVANLNDLSKLTGGRLKLAFIFYGETIDIVAGKDGLPAPASQPLREGCMEVLAKPCSGGTPLSWALEELNKILPRLAGENVTILSIGDGDPNLPLSPELFPTVRAEMDAEINRGTKEGGPEAVEEYLRRLQDQHSEELLQLFAIQQPLVMERCLQLAQVTNQLNPRIVSLAFCPKLVNFEAIHRAAGGDKSSYLEVNSSTAIRALHEANLVDGLISYPVIKLEPSDAFRVQEDVPLAKELNASSLVMVLLPPTPQIDEMATMGLQINGQKHVTGASTGSLSTAYDSQKRLATISVIAPPADNGTFAYLSPKQEISFPGAEIYRWIAPNEYLDTICRPKNQDPDAAPPYQLGRQKPDDWLVGFQYKTGQSVPLTSGEVVFRHTETGQQTLVPLVPDPQFTNLLMAPAQELDPGVYSVVMHLVLRSGLPASLVLEKHFEVVDLESRLRIAVGDSSFSVDRMDFGPLGDETLVQPVTMTLQSDCPWDLPLRMRVIDLKDAEGTPIGQAWITRTDEEELILPAGKSIDVTFECRLPEDTPEGIVDGVVTGTLEILNADTLQPPTILPAAEGIAAAESLQTVRLTLKRPQILVSAPRFWRDLILRGDDGNKLRVNANVSFPYDRRVKLTLATTSKVPRDLTIRLSRAHDDDGAVSESVELRAADEVVGTPLTVSPSESVTVGLPFSVDEAQRRGFGSILISGHGMQPVLLPFDVGSTLENGIWMHWVAWALFGLALSGAKVWRRRSQSLAEFCPSSSLDLNGEEPGKPYPKGNVLEIFAFEPSVSGIRLTPLVDGLLIEQEADALRPMEPEELVPVSDVLTLHSADGRSIEITGFDPDGETCWVNVIAGGPHEAERASVRRKHVVAAALAAFLFVFAIGVRFSPSFAGFVQWCVDVLYLS